MPRNGVTIGIVEMQKRSRLLYQIVVLVGLLSVKIR